MQKDLLANQKLHYNYPGLLDEMWQEAYKNRKCLSFQIASGSMSPFIERGNTVRVSRAEPSSIRIGDIVAFRHGQNVIVHRVIGRDWSNQRLIFRHRGDAGASSGKIKAQNIIGSVTAVVKKGQDIYFDSRRLVIVNRILGWRLRIIDTLDNRRYRSIGMWLRIFFRPAWKLCKGLLLFGV
jgi:signal peptidase I